MKYTYKERVRMAKKLKLFLAIFLAATIFFTGKVILDKTFAEDNDYGTATVTFNSGSDGHFEDGTTSNTVNYKLEKKITKYVHSDNIDDNGEFIADTYTTEETKSYVVTIPGATKIHIDIKYGFGNENSFSCIWKGNHENYIPFKDWKKSFTGKLNGRFYNLTDHNRHYDIDGDTITIGVCNSRTGSYVSEGYYAVITGYTDEGTLQLGEIISGEYKKPIGNDDKSFANWSTNLSEITGSTTVSAVYNDVIDFGTYDSVDWKLLGNNTLLIGKEGEIQTYDYQESRSKSNYPWNKYIDQIESVKVLGTVNGNGGHEEMFSGMKKLMELDVSNFNTSKITDMDSMFYNCYKIKEIDLSNFDTSNVTDMKEMFSGCHQLKDLNVNNFDTSKVTDMSWMFSYCHSLEDLDLSSFKPDNLYKISYMFYSCASLKNLDVINMNIKEISSYNHQYVFEYCSNLKTLKIGIDWVFYSDFKITGLWQREGDSNKYKAEELVSIYNGETMSGTYHNVSNYGLLYENGLLVYQNNDIANPEYGNLINIYKNIESGKIYESDYDDLVTNIIIEDEIDLISAEGLFYNFTNLKSIENLDYLNLSKVTNMGDMFNKCKSLTNIDVSNFSTENITSMRYMFADCESLVNLDVTNFDTHNVTNMAGMFSGLKISDLNIKNFDTSNVTNMSLMFDGCSNLISIDLTSFNTNNVTAMASMFRGCSNLINLDITGFNTSKVTEMDYMFSYCSNLTNLDVSNFNTSNVTDMSSMFDGCSNLISIDLTNFNTNNVTKMYCMFRGCSNLINLDITGFNTSKVTEMDYMFSYCSNLTNLDVSNFNTSNVTSMNYMFRGCSNLTSLDVTNFDTTNVENMAEMFGECTNLTNLDIKRFITNKVTNMSGMFYDCSSLTNLDLSNFNTSNVTSMNYMFRGCSNLTSIDVTSFDTTNVTNMIRMFEDCRQLSNIDVSSFNTSNVIYMSYVFEDCTSLISLDLSNFNTSRVEDMNKMLNNLASLNALKLGKSFSFVYKNNSYISDPSLTGKWVREGDEKVYTGHDLMTTYDGQTMAGKYIHPTATAILYDSGMLSFGFSSTPNEEYGNKIAKYSDFTEIDHTSDKEIPWYETRELVTKVKVEEEISTVSTAYWFYGMENVETIDIGNLNTSDATNTKYMFANCINLEKIYFYAQNDYSDSGTVMKAIKKPVKSSSSSSSQSSSSNFITTNVRDMSYMFYNCVSLKFLFLSTYLSGGGSYVSFRAASQNTSDYKNIELYNTTMFDTTNTVNMEKMFSGCLNLEKLDIRSFNTKNTINMDEMYKNTNNLKVLGLGENYAFLDNTQLTKSWIRDGDNILYPAEELTSIYNGEEMAGIYRSEDNKFALIYKDGSMVFQNGLELDDTKGELIAAYSGFEDGLEYSNSAAWEENAYYVEKVIFNTEVKPISTAYWFSGMNNLRSIENIENLNTENVFNMSYMFAGCNNLVKLDLSSFKTEEVKHFDYMFISSGIATLDLTSFDTSKAISIKGMFSHCFRLQILDISSFNIDENVYTVNMFDTTNSLRIITLGPNFSFNYSELDNPKLTYNWQKVGTSEILTAEELMSTYDGNTMNGTYINKTLSAMAHLLDDGTLLFTAGKLDSSTSEKVVKSYYIDELAEYTEPSQVPWYEDREAVLKINYDQTYPNPNSISYWFYGMTNLENVRLFFTTGSITKMDSAFENCVNLKYLDFTSFVNNKIVSMNNAFKNTNNLNYIELGPNVKLLSNSGLKDYWYKVNYNSMQGISIDNIYSTEELEKTYDGSTMAGLYFNFVKLTIKETTKGTMADVNKKFNYNIHFENDGEEMPAIDLPCVGTQTNTLKYADGKAQFSLKNGEQIEIYIEKNMDYIVTQEETNYTLSKFNDIGTTNTSTNIEFVNTLEGTTPTGIILNLIPYLLIVIISTISIIWIYKFRKI